MQSLQTYNHGTTFSRLLVAPYRATRSLSAHSDPESYLDRDYDSAVTGIALVVFSQVLGRLGGGRCALVRHFLGLQHVGDP